MQWQAMNERGAPNQKSEREGNAKGTTAKCTLYNEPNFATIPCFSMWRIAAWHSISEAETRGKNQIALDGSSSDT
jgi:hypothetical protein